MYKDLCLGREKCVENMDWKPLAHSYITFGVTGEGEERCGVGGKESGPEKKVRSINIKCRRGGA